MQISSVGQETEIQDLGKVNKPKMKWNVLRSTTVKTIVCGDNKWENKSSAK